MAMMNFNLQDRIVLTSEIIGMEDHLPSFNISMEVKQFITSSNRVIFQFDSLWFAREAWDSFLKCLFSVNDEFKASLFDLSSEVNITISKSGNGSVLFIGLNNSNINGRLSSAYSQVIEEDELAIIKNSAKRFATWW